jgi:hypothetical protein
MTFARERADFVYLFTRRPPMTCVDFATLIACPRSHEQLTRAERRTLLTHVIECPECLRWTASAWLRDMHERPDDAMAHLVGGIEDAASGRAGG